MRTTGHEKRSKKEDVDADDKQERHSGRSRSCVSIDCANPGGADFVRRGASSLPVFGNGVANDRAVSRGQSERRRWHAGKPGRLLYGCEEGWRVEDSGRRRNVEAEVGWRVRGIAGRR